MKFNTLIRKQKRVHNRNRWKKYLRLINEGEEFTKPLEYLKLKKYEFRKRRKKMAMTALKVEQ